MKLNNFLTSDNKSSYNSKSLKFPQLNELPSPTYPSQSTLRSLEGKSSSTARSLNNTSATGLPSGNKEKDVASKKRVLISIDKEPLSYNKNEEEALIPSVKGMLIKDILADDEEINPSKLKIPKRRLLKKQDSKMKSLDTSNSRNRSDDKAPVSIGDNTKAFGGGGGRLSEEKPYKANKNMSSSITSIRIKEKNQNDVLPSPLSILPKNKKSNSTPNINESYLRAILQTGQPSPTQENFLKSFRKIDEFESKQLGLSEYSTLVNPRRLNHRPSTSVEFLNAFNAEREKQS